MVLDSVLLSDEAVSKLSPGFCHPLRNDVKTVPFFP